MLEIVDPRLEDTLMNCNLKVQFDTEARLDKCFAVEIHKSSSKTEIV